MRGEKYWQTCHAIVAQMWFSGGACCKTYPSCVFHGGWSSGTPRGCVRRRQWFQPELPPQGSILEAFKRGRAPFSQTIEVASEASFVINWLHAMSLGVL
eukprot:1582876-Pyramimonas_sp.AAC.1